MTEEQKKQVMQEYTKYPDDFTCYYCKFQIGVTSCNGCPIYVWGHNPD